MEDEGAGRAAGGALGALNRSFCKEATKQIKIKQGEGVRVAMSTCCL